MEPLGSIGSIPPKAAGSSHPTASAGRTVMLLSAELIENLARKRAFCFLPPVGQLSGWSTWGRGFQHRRSRVVVVLEAQGWSQRQSLSRFPSVSNPGPSPSPGPSPGPGLGPGASPWQHGLPTELPWLTAGSWGWPAAQLWGLGSHLLLSTLTPKLLCLLWSSAEMRSLGKVVLNLPVTHISSRDLSLKNSKFLCLPFSNPAGVKGQ